MIGFAKALSWRKRAALKSVLCSHNRSDEIAGRRPSMLLDDEGSSIIEMALVSMMTLALLLGIIEISWATYTYHAISELAREGARYAMVRGSGCTSLDNCSATGAQIQTWIQSRGYVGKGNLNVNTTWFSASATQPTTWTSCGTTQCNSPGNAVQVQVTYAFPLLLVALPKSTLNMSSTSQMVIAN